MVRAQHEKALARMLDDAKLPADIHPATSAISAAPQVVFLTGGLGFLGRHIAREFLTRKHLHLICLARSKSGKSAEARLKESLAMVGVDSESIQNRLEILEGDICLPNFGLDHNIFAGLAKRVDLIVHSAAQLDWVQSYARLRKPNVGGVLEIIRLASFERAIRIVFVSSIAVCYAENAPEKIDEQTDMLPYVSGMPLGYAQSKCIAESLLREASSRGVPVTVVRPALISGDSISGHSSQDDFIAALIQNCVNSGMALDVDWMLDCVPANYVARTIADVPQGDDHYQVLNLVHTNPRHWRELVLWMNLHGYPVKLVGSKKWTQEQFEQRKAKGDLIYLQRRFFRGKGGYGKSQAPYEIYLAHSQNGVDSYLTQNRLEALSIKVPPLDSELLHTYFHDYRTNGLLKSAANDNGNIKRPDNLLAGTWKSQFFENSEPALVSLESKKIGSENSILSELTSARLGQQFGLWKVRFRNNHCVHACRDSQGILKTKAEESVVRELTLQLADMCDSELGCLFETFYPQLEFTGSHERELAIYEMEDSHYRKYLPTCYATHRDSSTGRSALLLEYLPEAKGEGQSYEMFISGTGLSAVLNGLAEIHSVWYDREPELTNQTWLNPRLDSVQMEEMSALWRALANFAGKWFRQWCGTEITSIQEHLVETLPWWWTRLHGMPATLIHNDFNPRNIILRTGESSPQLCVFDWELAAVGAPQHDLAELLCFIWKPEMSAESLAEIVDTHRQALSNASGQNIDNAEWREGFALSLRHLLLNRLATYTLIQHFRPLEYLPKVMQNWMQLYRLTSYWLDTEARTQQHHLAEYEKPG